MSKSNFLKLSQDEHNKLALLKPKLQQSSVENSANVDVYNRY